YKQTVNWQVLEGLSNINDIEAAALPFLETESFNSSVVLDALNRPVSTIFPDGSVMEPSYNEANMLESLKVKVRGQGNFVTFLEDQDYDAKGQRQFVKYGNGLITD